jgi:hypothetical protein
VVLRDAVDRATCGLRGAASSDDVGPEVLRVAARQGDRPSSASFRWRYDAREPTSEARRRKGEVLLSTRPLQYDAERKRAEIWYSHYMIRISK